ncbi:MAG: dethiobiotin synthase [bacterium]
MIRGIFITGTDTNVGKTWFSVRFIQTLQQYGLRITPRKPIESGWLDDTIEQTDAYRLMKAASTNTLPTNYGSIKHGSMMVELEKICPYHFPAALSPPRAAQFVNQSLTIQQLINTCFIEDNKTDQHNHNIYLVEGAGGFYSPLTQDGLNADLAHALQLPIILVVDDKLGCINHTLLSLAAIKEYGLTTLCIYLNQRSEANNQMDNAKDLQELTAVPIYTDVISCAKYYLATIKRSI